MPASSAPSRSATKLLKWETRAAWTMSTPALLLLTVFLVLPLVLGGYYSLTNARLISPLPTQFLGLSNFDQLLSVSVITVPPQIDPSTGEAALDGASQIVYPRTRTLLRANPAYADYSEWFSIDWLGRHDVILAKDPIFMRALMNTFLFVLCIVPLQSLLALAMALLVNQRLRGTALFRTIYFAPVVMSMAVIAIVWTYLYIPDNGLINNFLKLATFGQVHDVPWLLNKHTAMPAIILLTIWQAAGLQMVLFLAGLQQIPETLYEAALVDGANGWQRFRFITVPQLRNSIVLVLVSTTIFSFRIFTQVDVITKGGPENSTMTLVYYAVQQGFREQRIGYGSAITLIFFIIVLAVALVQRLVVKSNNVVQG